MKTSCIVACMVTLLACKGVFADTRVDSHAPIGVMGDHRHKQGELMVSYRYMRMEMGGNRDGTRNLSPGAIVAVPNRFANLPMQPPTLRVVPTRMTTDMHMFGVMFAPSHRITLMGMASYLKKKMDHITFRGATGSNRLGKFTTQTSGAGDTRVMALIGLNHNPHSRWHATVGVSLPTGDIKQSDAILTPADTRPSPRLPYPMQLGSGTYDAIVGLTYAANSGTWGWGGQSMSTVRLGENDAGYSFGNEHRLSGWLSYTVTPRLSLSGRLAYYERGNISGRDRRIVAPVQTADPDRQGIERWDLIAGANVLFSNQHRIALDFSVPLTQDLDGPQLETDWQLILGWQYTY